MSSPSSICSPLEADPYAPRRELPRYEDPELDLLLEPVEP
jgi:hypothetical protein